MILHNAIAAATFWMALNLLLLIWLGWKVVQVRQREKIGLGDGGNENMLRAMRIQANLTEYAPMFFIGLFALAVMDMSIYIINGLGGVFTIARYAHGLNFHNPKGGTPLGRFYGTLFTWISVVVLALLLLWAVFAGPIVAA